MGMQCSVKLSDKHGEIVLCPESTTSGSNSSRRKLTAEERERRAFERSKSRTKEIVKHNFSANDFVGTKTFPAGTSNKYRKKWLNNAISRLAYHCKKRGIVLKYLYVWGHGNGLIAEDDSHGWGHRYGDNGNGLHFHILLPAEIDYDSLLKIFGGIGNFDIQRANELCHHLTEGKKILDDVVDYFYKNYSELNDEDKKIVGTKHRVYYSKGLPKPKTYPKSDGETLPNEFDIAAEEDNADSDIIIKGEPSKIAQEIVNAYDNGFGDFEKLKKVVEEHIVGVELDRYQPTYSYIKRDEYGIRIRLSVTPVCKKETVVEKPKSKLEQALDSMIVSPLLRLKDVLVKKGGLIKDRFGEYRVKINISHELINPIWKAFKEELGMPSFDSPNSVQRRAFEDRLLSLLKT